MLYEVITKSDEKRMTIPEVTLTKADGTQIVFRSGSPVDTQLETRVMDCIDCHNRPTHIYRTPDAALDEQLMSGAIPTELPFIKEQALRVIKENYVITSYSIHYTKLYDLRIINSTP